MGDVDSEVDAAGLVPLAGVAESSLGMIKAFANDKPQEIAARIENATMLAEDDGPGDVLSHWISWWRESFLISCCVS